MAGQNVPSIDTGGQPNTATDMNTLTSIASRDDFPALLNSLDLTHEAVEVGVYRGAFSATILERWEGDILYSIDPWKHQEGVLLDRSNVQDDEHHEAYRECVELLRKFGPRSHIIRDFSVSASTDFFDKTLDFVYLDARHDYRSVTNDLNAWWPKVKVGGILAGHDYFDKFVRKNLVEVKRAVDTFFQHGQLETINVTTDDNLPSWYVVKTK